jgi:hypothetical protein
MKFLNKYRQVGDSGVKSPTGRGTLSVNTLAEQQRAEMQGLAGEEAARLATTEQGMDLERRQRALQSDQQLQQLRNESTSQKQKYSQVTNQLNSELKRGLTDLSEREKLDKMEGVAASMRLADEKYVYQLQDEGRRRRLDDASQFDLALKEAVFADEISLLRDDYRFKTILDMDEAEFQKSLANMDIASAFALFSSQKKDANQASMISGIGTVATKGAGYFAGQKETPVASTTADTPTDTSYTDTRFRMQGVE